MNTGGDSTAFTKKFLELNRSVRQADICPSKMLSIIVYSWVLQGMIREQMNIMSNRQMT